MDVNLTISLIRGEMGVVIEKAVAVAVETVLGEMMKVVSIKFDEFRKEIHLKEKENENVRQMLEISKCQMRAMRKYLSVSNAKEDRPNHCNQRQVNQFDSVRLPEVHLGQPAFSQTLPHGGNAATQLCQRALQSQASTETRKRTLTQGPLESREDHKVTSNTVEDSPTENPSQTDVRLIASDGTTFLTSIKQEVPEAHDQECQLERVLDTANDQPPSGLPHSSSPPERTSTDPVDPQSRSPAEEDGLTKNGLSSRLCSAATLIKEEMVETNMVSIKQEPLESRAEVEVEVEGDYTGLGKGEGHCQGGYLEGGGTQQVTAGPSMSQTATYYSPCSSSSTYTTSQPGLPLVTSNSMVTSAASSSALSSVGMDTGMVGSRQGRPWIRDLGLYEQYKQARSELRRRSQMRKKQLEQHLPQALLADLVKERREKTRLRVARWRAKRRLQACLVAAQGAGAAGSAAASNAAAQVGQAMQRVAMLQIQVPTQTRTGGQQQRLPGRQQLQQQPHPPSGRTGQQYGGRAVGQACQLSGVGPRQGLSTGNMPLDGETGGAGPSLSGQTFTSAGRFGQQRAPFGLHASRGTDTGMY